MAISADLRISAGVDISAAGVDISAAGVGVSAEVEVSVEVKISPDVEDVFASGFFFFSCLSGAFVHLLLRGLGLS